jgi:hypothetical protein
VEKPPNSRLPHRRIAVVQSDLERLQAPYTDLGSFARDFPDWHADLFTDATITVLIQSAERFDCIVFAENAIDQSEAVAASVAALGFPRTNAVIMPQNKLVPSYRLIERSFGVATDVAPPGDVRLLAPVGMAVDLESTLCWPEKIPLDAGLVGLETEMPIEWTLRADNTGGWQPVLEIERGSVRLPVVLRTGEGVAPRTVVCAVRLNPIHAVERALLRNLIAFAAGGKPAAAVVGEPGPEATVLAGKLRLQGMPAIQVSSARHDRIPISDWPLGATRKVVLGKGWDVDAVERTEDAAAWLGNGGTLVGLGAEGRMTYRHGATDARWVAERWAAWLHTRDPATWHGGPTASGADERGSIMASRSVLKVLDALFEPSAATFPDRLGLSSPLAYRAAIEALVSSRTSHEGHLERTIGPTAAALDLLRLCDSHAVVGDKIETWLRKIVKDASLLDQLDIARCLRDPALLERALDRVRPPVRSPLLAARLCQAGVACGQETRVTFQQSDGSELDDSLLLAGEYLGAIAEHQAVFPGRLDDATAEGVERAIAALARWGTIRRLADGATPTASEHDTGSADIVCRCTEATALLRYFQLSPVQTHTLVEPDSSSIRPIVEPVLRQLQVTRSALDDTAQRAQAAESARVALERRLHTASHAFGVLTSLLALAAVVAVLVLLDVDAASILFAASVGAVIFVGLGVALDLIRLTPPWVKAGAGWVARGWSGLLRSAGTRFGSRDSDGQEPTRRGDLNR